MRNRQPIPLARVEDAFDCFEGHWARYRQGRTAIERISALVQDNQEFFDAVIGKGCLETAAIKLERLVQEAKP